MKIKNNIFAGLNKFFVAVIILMLFFSQSAFARIDFRDSQETAPEKNNEEKGESNLLSSVLSNEVDLSQFESYEEGGEIASRLKISSTNNKKENNYLTEAPDTAPIGLSPSSTKNTDFFKDSSLNNFGNVYFGSYSTDLSTGSASYSYSLEVSSGINGLEPQIDLSYNHHQSSKTGILGEGWSIGLSHISRDINGTLSDSSDDFFRLNFNGDSKLVYSSADNRYHTEIESYIKIEKKTGGKNELGEYWEVKTKDGTLYRFGYNKNSEFVSNQENFVSIWSLDLIQDSYGNSIFYSYDEYLGNDYYPYLVNITYGNENNFVIFNYNSSYVNGFNGYNHGTEIAQNSLLDNVEIYSNNNLFSKYHFGYEDIHGKKFLNKLTRFGNDGVSFLPALEFSYNKDANGWVEKQEYALPSEAFLGSTLDRGTRIFDINGDGYEDLVRMYDSSNMDYWINNKNGWGSKSTYNSLFASGFVNAYGHDLGVRFFDINGDGKLDIIKMLYDSGSFRQIFVNKGNNFQEENLNIPIGFEFTKTLGEAYSCNVQDCPAGTFNQGVSCGNGVCYRSCSGNMCSDSGNVVMNDYSDSAPDWNDNDYDNMDYGNSFVPQQNKCYLFEITGSSATDSDDSQCYDLTTQDYGYDYGHDCNGRDIDAFGGIGFRAYPTSSSWLKTVKPNEGGLWVGGVDNGYWGNRYLSYYKEDVSPDDSGSNAGEWDGLNSAVCEEAGTYSVSCAPNQEMCGLWNYYRCGYGCQNQETRPWVALGVYSDYDDGIENAFNGRWDCDSHIIDNDYIGDSVNYKVTEFPLELKTVYYSCNYNPKYSVDAGTRAVDLNNDGKVDFIKSVPSSRKVLINNGERFEEQNWDIPSEAIFTDDSGNDLGTRIIDLNSDGFVDLVRYDSSIKKIWLNTGKGWVETNKISLPQEVSFGYMSNSGALFADLNNDGKVDIIQANSLSRKIWLNDGKQWIQQSWSIPYEISFSTLSSSLADLNADGLPDLVYSKDSNNNKVWVNDFIEPYLLDEIKNPFGGKIKIDYKKISELNNKGSDDINDLPFSGWVVSAIKTYDSLQNISESLYNYSGGYYDAYNKEFRGFSYANEKLGDGSTIEHYFNQDDSKKGTEYKTVIKNANASIMNSVENEFISRKINNIYEIELNSTINSFYYNDLIKQAKTAYSYDTYGNLIEITNFGDLNVDGDEKFHYLEYEHNLERWILNNPIHTYSLNSSFAKIEEETNQYNLFGDLIRKELWNNYGENVITNYEYDSYGNLIGYIDGKGYKTEYKYDSKNTFLYKLIDAKKYENTYQYDLNGNLISEIDANGFKIEYTYDAFGRKTKEILPYDSVSSPTTQITYNFDGTSPESIALKQKEDSSGTYDRYYFYDGFGNIIQEKSEAQNGKFITLDIFYDAKKRISKQSLPYYNEYYEYNSFNNSMPYISYEYDALDRITKIKNPDNTEKINDYLLLNYSSYDENGNRKDTIKNIYAEIIQVIEYNANDRYVTNYYYDGLRNVIKIIDSQGNILEYKYDSLGRKKEMKGPDLGIWKYEYDGNGNLISQNDSKGNSITLEYDELNRIKRKISENITLIYDYDKNKIGTLSSVISGATRVDYEYDNRLRKIKEKRQINEQNLISTYEYDSLDRIKKLTLPNGQIISYLYNLQNEAGFVPNFFSIDYNELGLPISRNYYNGLNTNIYYNNTNFRLSSIKTSGKQNLRYAYDNVGNVKEIKDSLKNTSSTFVYDNLNRLVKAVKQDNRLVYNNSYSYDSLGKITAISSIRTVFEFKYNFLSQANFQTTTELIDANSNIVHAPLKIKRTKIFPLQGDIDYNGIVNILDLASIGVCWNLEGENECFYPDLDDDGKVTLIDLATVGKNFGKTLS